MLVLFVLRVLVKIGIELSSIMTAGAGMLDLLLEEAMLSLGGLIRA